jgi:hypothetical protein
MGLNLSAFKTLGELENVRAEANGVERRYVDLAGIVIEAGMIEKINSAGGHDHQPMDMPLDQVPGEPDGAAGVGAN